MNNFENQDFNLQNVTDCEFSNIQRAAIQSNLPVLKALLTETQNFNEKVFFSTDDQQTIQESPSALYLSTLSSNPSKFDCFLTLLQNGAEFKNPGEIIKAHGFTCELILNLSIELQQTKTSLNSIQSSQLQDIKTIDQLKIHANEEEMLHNHFLNEFTGAVQNTEILKSELIGYAQRCHFLETRIEEIEQPYKNELDKLYLTIDVNHQEIEALRREREQFSRVFDEKNAEINFLREKVSKNLREFSGRSKEDKETIERLTDDVETLKHELKKNLVGFR